LFAPRLLRARPADAVIVPAREDLANRTVLVTGGMGELGKTVSKHLVKVHGVRHLVLASRRGSDVPDAARLIEELRALGAETVEIAALDVARKEEVSALLAHIQSSRPLMGVVHLSAFLDDGRLEALTPERFSSVLAPKVD